MSTIAFIAAMSREIKPFLRRVGPYTRTSLASFPLYRFGLFDRECALIDCGIGLGRATEAARVLLSSEHPQVLVSFGVAGAATAELRVGDVVAIDSVCRLDRVTLDNPHRILSWSEAARQAAALVLSARGARLFSGTAVTTNGEQVVPIPALERPVLEMETAGIALAASERAVPLLALRAISDSVDEPLPFSIAESLDEHQRLRIGRILSAAIRHPRLLPRLARLGRNMARATDALVIALLAALPVELARADFSQPSHPG